MSFTYSGDPDNSPKDAVRFLIGDTDKCDPLLDDEEIKYFLGQYNDGKGVINAAIRCCETIAAKFSRRVTEKVGQVSMNFSDAGKQYRAMALDLRRRLAMEDSNPYAGGISRSDKKTVEQNGDRVKPDFTKHMMENEQIAPWVSNENGLQDIEALADQHGD